MPQILIHLIPHRHVYPEQRNSRKKVLKIVDRLRLKVHATQKRGNPDNHRNVHCLGEVGFLFQDLCRNAAFVEAEETEDLAESVVHAEDVNPVGGSGEVGAALRVKV